MARECLQQQVGDHTVTSDPQVEELIRTLRNLAAPASIQILYLERLGTAPGADELGLEFDDALKALGHQRLRARFFNAAPGVSAVDSALTAMSGVEHEHLWTTEALTHRAEWVRVRELSAEALKELNGLLDG